MDDDGAVSVGTVLRLHLCERLQRDGLERRGPFRLIDRALLRSGLFYSVRRDADATFSLLGVGWSWSRAEYYWWSSRLVCIRQRAKQSLSNFWFLESQHGGAL